MSLKVFFDTISQPSRAVLLFCKANQKFIPFSLQPVALRKLEHRSDDYGKINPLKKVPAILDNGYKLSESVAILKYLSDKYNVPDHWYPKQLEGRARVDEYMSWQHLNTRLHLGKLFLYEIIQNKAVGKEPDPKKLAKYEGEAEETLTNMEKFFLKDQPYLCGSDISIADLMGVCEVVQLSAAGRDISEAHPHLDGWVQRIRKQLNPDFDEAHQIVYQMRNKFKKV